MELLKVSVRLSLVVMCLQIAGTGDGTARQMPRFHLLSRGAERPHFSEPEARPRSIPGQHERTALTRPSRALLLRCFKEEMSASLKGVETNVRIGTWAFSFQTCAVPTDQQPLASPGECPGRGQSSGSPE